MKNIALLMTMFVLSSGAFAADKKKNEAPASMSSQSEAPSVNLQKEGTYGLGFGFPSGGGGTINGSYF